MESKQRRIQILEQLKSSKNPIKGIKLANKFNVSRQVIVQDIAILRAKGENILATPQGYINGIEENKYIKKRIVSKHSGYEAIEDELNTIVDNGGRVLNVIVEHPVYGEIESPLMISSRLEIKNFMKNLKEFNAEPLSTLTDGIHIHTIEVLNESIYCEIEKELKRKKYLINSI